MKIACSVGRLGAALDFIADAVPRHSPISILNHCKLAVADGKLVASATDLDHMLIAELDAPDSEPGSTTVPCARLKRLVAELPESAEATLAADDDRLRIACGRGRWSLPTLPAEDFPELLAPGEDAATFVIPQAEVRRLVQRLTFAISTEETRYYLNGIHVYARGAELVAVATDTRRLSETVVAVNPGAMPAIIVPRSAVAALDEIDADITMRVSADRVAFSAGDRRCVSKLIDARFPDYAHVLPRESENRVSVDARALRAAIKRLDAVIEAKALDHGVGLQWGDDKFSVCLREDDAGIEELTPISCLGSGRVAAQAHYLIEQLEALDADAVVIDHAAPASPIRITRPDEPGTTSIVMEMRWDRRTAAAEPARKQA